MFDCDPQNTVKVDMYEIIEGLQQDQGISGAVLSSHSSAEREGLHMHTEAWCCCGEGFGFRRIYVNSTIVVTAS